CIYKFHRVKIEPGLWSLCRPDRLWCVENAVMGLAAVALGSNLESGFGDREANLREAIKRLATLGTVRAVSSFHDTEPVGVVSQPRFLNAALLLETELEPRE